MPLEKQFGGPMVMLQGISLNIPGATSGTPQKFYGRFYEMSSITPSLADPNSIPCQRGTNPTTASGPTVQGADDTIK